MSVTVLPQTNSSAGRGTKFKVTAVMMTRRWVGGGSLVGDAGLVLKAQMVLPDWSKSTRPVSEWARFGTRT